MKSFISRWRTTTNSPPPSRTSSSTTVSKDKEQPSVPPPAPPQAKTSVKRSPAPILGSSPLAPVHSHSSSSSSDSTRPRSAQELSEEEALHDIAIFEDLENVRNQAIQPSGDGGGKKVTFRSPAPTPTASGLLEEAAPRLGAIIEADPGNAQREHVPETAKMPTKKPSTGNLNGLEPSSRSSTAQSAASSRPLFSSRQSLPVTSRKACLPPLRHPSHSNSSFQPGTTTPSNPSIVSPAPSDASLPDSSTRSYLPPPNSWSEMAEEDLIANLAPRERTRQEVLYEIVSSEERSVSHRLLPADLLEGSA